MSAVRNSQLTDNGVVRISGVIFPEKHEGREYSVLEPYILQEHAEKDTRLHYQAIEEDGCPKVVVSKDPQYFESDSVGEGELAYSSKTTPEGVTILEMYLNPRSEVGKATGSKPWNDIIKTLKEESREREQKMIDLKHLVT